MAINPSTNGNMSGRITAPDADYTYGSSKDETGAGAGDGTPYFKGRANDLFGWQQALLRLASIVPTGDAETQLASQYVQSMIELSAGRAISYDESGVADVYVLDIRAGQQTPPKYFDGMRISFRPGNANTGPSTVDVAANGVKNFKTSSGADPAAGDLSAGGLVTAVFDSVNDWFELSTVLSVPDASTTVKGIVELATNTETQTGTDAVRAVTPAGLASVTALESRAGLAEIATQAETDAGTDNSRIVTPLKLNKAVSSCKAWVTFNGTGVVAILDSFNVSSITDRGTGRYSVNFLTPMANANYCPVVVCSKDDASDDANINVAVGTTTLIQTAAVGIVTCGRSVTPVDSPQVSYSVHGDT
jgi:hypothetical protein